MDAEENETIYNNNIDTTEERFKNLKQENIDLCYKQNDIIECIEHLYEENKKLQNRCNLYYHLYYLYIDRHDFYKKFI